MPSLSWYEVKARAIEFAQNPYWHRATSERADKQTFYNDFLMFLGFPGHRLPVLKSTFAICKATRMPLIYSGVAS
jgi:hypothetical protein